MNSPITLGSTATGTSLPAVVYTLQPLQVALQKHTQTQASEPLQEEIEQSHAWQQ